VWIENEQVGVENNYILGSEEDEIHIKYVCVDHKQGGRIKYRYRMTGVDDFWNTTMDRELTYRSIPYGKHKLYMSYQMSDGNWSTQIPVLHINRYPPFYMQIWFYFSLAGLITLSIYLLQRRSHQKKLRKKDMQLMIAELERQAYQSQMNPHFIFNAMNTIQSFISQAENRKAEMYLSKFSRLVRAALNHSELKFVSLEEEMEIISMYLEIEMMRFPEKFRYVIKTDDRLDPMEVKIPPMIIQPFVENSIVHGLLKKETAGFLKIKLDYFDHRFVMVTIEDNGVGRKKASAYKLSKYESKGIKITQARLLLLDAESKIEIIDLEEKGTARGTRVNLKIPIKND
jgi:sensor histidine kinase YesM